LSGGTEAALNKIFIFYHLCVWAKHYRDNTGFWPYLEMYGVEAAGANPTFDEDVADVEAGEWPGSLSTVRPYYQGKMEAKWWLWTLRFFVGVAAAIEGEACAGLADSKAFYDGYLDFEGQVYDQGFEFEPD
jgi:hypothetical protein